MGNSLKEAAGSCLHGVLGVGQAFLIGIAFPRLVCALVITRSRSLNGCHCSILHLHLLSWPCRGLPSLNASIQALCYVPLLSMPFELPVNAAAYQYETPF